MKFIPVKLNTMIEYETGIHGFEAKFKELGAEKLYESCKQETNNFAL